MNERKVFKFQVIYVNKIHIHTHINKACFMAVPAIFVKMLEFADMSELNDGKLGIFFKYYAKFLYVQRKLSY